MTSGIAQKIFLDGPNELSKGQRSDRTLSNSVTFALALSLVVGEEFTEKNRGGGGKTDTVSDLKRIIFSGCGYATALPVMQEATCCTTRRTRHRAVARSPSRTRLKRRTATQRRQRLALALPWTTLIYGMYCGRYSHIIPLFSFF